MNRVLTREHLHDRGERLRQTPQFSADMMLLALFEDVAAEMERSRVSRAELARRLGVSGAAVTRMLNGYSDLKVSTIAKLAAALGLRPEIQLRPVRTADICFRRSTGLSYEVISHHGANTASAEELAVVPFAA